VPHKIETRRLELILLTTSLIDDLLAGRRQEAQVEGGFVMPSNWPDEHDSAFLRMRREQIRADPRIDTEELRIVCRHGVVYLDGALPSEVEHQMVLKSVQDVAGFQEVVDHVRVEALAWEREDRTRRGARTRRASAGESVGTEDVVEAVEEGVDFIPPDRPPSDEE